MKQTEAKQYIVVETDNIGTDITVSEPMEAAAARNFLEASFRETSNAVFCGRELKDPDTAVCCEDSYAIFDSRHKDMYYGYVKEIQVPVISESQRFAQMNLKNADADVRCRILANHIAKNLHLLGVDNHEEYGKEILTAVANRDMDKLLYTLTGKTVMDLLREAYLAVCNERYSQYVRAYISGTMKCSNEPFACEATINNTNNCVESITINGTQIESTALTAILDCLESPTIRVANMPESFRLYCRNDVPEGLTETVCWY